MNRKTALVPVANGSEDIESVTLIDVLRRAGVEVTVASVEQDLQVTCSRHTRITADTRLTEVQARDFDLIALPGGMPGAERLRDCAALVALLKKQDARGALIGAICASPGVVLGAHGLVGLRIVTVYPGFEGLLPAGSVQDAAVVRGGNLVTGRGPAAAMAFALALVEALCGRASAEQVAGGLLTAL